MGQPDSRAHGPFLTVCGVVMCLLGVLAVYSQTSAFAWDEGYHVLAAQLISGGKRPYLDFCFPQAPLNAFWNAGWMRLFPGSWRAVHGLAAVVTAGTILLAADFVYTRFPVPAWRLPGAVATALLIGLNATVIEYATTGQPYALCLFLIVAAFRAAVRAAERQGRWSTAAAGFLASAAAGCSLLAVTAPLVLLVWTVRRTRAGERWGSFRTFLAGAAVPLLPVLWLFLKGPRQTFFNLFEYHLFYRRANWEDATSHDWSVLTSWLTSPQAWTLGLLAAAGLWFAAKASSWDRAWRSEVALCGWLALGIGAELCSAHPTFEWYFVLVIPFLAIPAATGLYAATATLRVASPWWPVTALLVVFAGGGAKSLYQDRHTMTWRDLEAVARKVEEVTPRGAGLWADEQIYFLTRRPPAEGTELSYAEVIDLPDPPASSLHIVPLDELDRRAAAGVFRTVSTCEEAEQIEALDLPRLFRHQAAVGICHVFWDPAGRANR